VAAFVLIHDISRHRKAEQSMRESEERLRKFSEATQSGIIFHEDGVVTDCNDALLRLTGYKYDELVGSQIIQYVVPGVPRGRRSTPSAAASSGPTSPRSSPRTAP
jgi:PAS domain-containing protein